MRRSKDCQSLELIIRDRDSKIRDSVTPTPPNPPLPAPKEWSIQRLSGVLRCVLNFLTYVYLLRFPLIVFIIVALFIIKAKGWAKMLAGAFDQSSFNQTLALGLTNILFVYALLVIGHNVLGYSALRGTARELKRNDNDTNLWHHVWNSLCLAVALSVPLTAWYYSRGSIGGISFIAAILLGTSWAALSLR